MTINGGILPHTVNLRQKLQCLNCPSQVRSLRCGYLWMVLASPGPQSSSGVASGRHVVGSVLTSFFLPRYPLISTDIHWDHITIPRIFTNIPSNIPWKFYEKPQDSLMHLEVQDRRVWSTTMTKQKIYDISYINICIIYICIWYMYQN